MNDKLIIENVLDGDIEKFSYLVNKYKEYVFSIAYRVLNNSEDAEEVTQDVFIKTFKSLNKHKVTSKFSNWIYRIAYTTSISRLRRNKYHNKGRINNFEQLEINYESTQASSHIETSESKKIVAEVLCKLETEDKLLISLFYYNNCSIKDISQIIGIEESNVKVRLYRIRKKLYKYFIKNHIFNNL